MNFISKFLILCTIALGTLAHAASPRETCEQMLKDLTQPKWFARVSYNDSANDRHPYSLVEDLEFPAEYWATSNAKEFDYLKNLNLPKQGRPSYQELVRILKTVSDHDVTKLECLKQYDPSGEIGFCFGRAFAAHVESMMSNIDEMFILKGFVVGTFKMPEFAFTWRYHVTTLVLCDDGVWYALDPRQPRPLPVDEWYNENARFEVKPTGFFVTPARRLTPGHKEYYRPSFFRRRWRESDAKAVAIYLRAIAESYLK